MAVSVLAAWWFYSRGYTLYYGDAEAHLRIARQIVDSKTPGYEQVGTVWLPLLHWLLIPFVKVDTWWRSGLAGVFPSAAAFVLAGMFLYLAARRAFDSSAAGVAAAFSLALNPNLLYLQSTPMTESLFLACETGLIAALVWFAHSQRALAIVLAGMAALAGTLTRYDGWFLLPFAALVILASAKKNRLGAALLFCSIAGLGPAYWLLHNRWFYSNWLEFYNGPYSPQAIQGGEPYPGHGDWSTAFRYYWAAARTGVGLPLILAGAAGLIGVLAKKAWQPLILLAAVPIFYVWNIHSGASPVKLPDLWPGGYYNTRYGMAVLPFAAFAAAGIVAITPRALRGLTAVAVIAISLSPWLAYPRRENWITLQESVENSAARRAWTHQAADYLRREYKPRDGVFTSFGDQTRIYREAGIPLRETLHEGNGLIWHAARMRPDLFLWQRWIVAIDGDLVSKAMKQAILKGRKIERAKILKVNGAPSIEIYRNADSLRKSPRGKE